MSGRVATFTSSRQRPYHIGALKEEVQFVMCCRHRYESVSAALRTRALPSHVSYSRGHLLCFGRETLLNICFFRRPLRTRNQCALFQRRDGLLSQSNRFIACDAVSKGLATAHGVHLQQRRAYLAKRCFRRAVVGDYCGHVECTAGWRLDPVRAGRAGMRSSGD